MFSTILYLLNKNNGQLLLQLKIASSVWNLGSGGGRSFRNHQGRLAPEVSLRQLRLIENLGSCVHGQVISWTKDNAK